MPKLERIYQPIFGSQGNNDEFAVFGSMKSGTPVYSKSLATLFQSPAFLQGFQDSVAADKAPWLEEVNALFLAIFQQLAYNFQTGFPEWNAETTYYANTSFCQVNGVVYKSLTNENIGNNPATDTTNWEVWNGGGSGSSLPLGTMFFSQGFVDETKGLVIGANGQILANNANTKGFIDWVVESAALNTDFATTEANWQAEVALNPEGICGKYVINYGSNNEVVSVRLPKYPDWAVQTLDFTGDVPIMGNGKAIGYTTGTTNFSLRINSGNVNYADITTQGYGTVVGTSVGVTKPTPAGVSVGPTTDPENTGYKGTLSNIKSAKVKGKWYIQIATGQETEVIVNNELEALPDAILFEPKYSATPLYDTGFGLAGATKTKAIYPDAYNALLIELNPDVAVGTTVDITDTFSYTKRGLDVKETGDSAITDYSWTVNKTDESFTCPTKARVGAVNEAGTVPVRFGTGVSTVNVNSHPVGGLVATTVPTTGGQYSGIGAYGPESGGASSGTTLVINLSSASSGLNLYFRIANVAQNAALANLGRMEETLPQIAAHAAMPSNRFDNLAIVFNTPYEAPADGMVTVNLQVKANYLLLQNNNTLEKRFFWAKNGEIECGMNLNCKKGDKYILGTSTPENIYKASFNYGLHFNYAEGMSNV